MDSIIIIMFAAIIFVAILLLVIITTTRKAPKGINREEFRLKWIKIESTLGEDESINQMAVLNADKLLDQALKARGFAGETMAERMKKAENQFKDKKSVWLAHKLRNRIAHEDIVIKRSGAKKALVVFKRSLRDLGAL